MRGLVEREHVLRECAPMSSCVLKRSSDELERRENSTVRRGEEQTGERKSSASEEHHLSCPKQKGQRLIQTHVKTQQLMVSLR